MCSKIILVYNDDLHRPVLTYIDDKHIKSEYSYY